MPLKQIFISKPFLIKWNFSLCWCFPVFYLFCPVLSLHLLSWISGCLFIFLFDVMLSLHTQHVESPCSSNFPVCATHLVLLSPFLSSLCWVCHLEPCILHRTCILVLLFPSPSPSLSLSSPIPKCLFSDYLSGLQAIPVSLPCPAIHYPKVCQIDLLEFYFLFSSHFFFSLKLSAAPCFQNIKT